MKSLLRFLFFASVSLSLVCFVSCAAGKSGEKTNYEVNDEFNSIYIVADTENIVLKPSVDSECKVSCYNSNKLWHSISVEDGELVIKVVDERRWYEKFFNFGTQNDITVFIPRENSSSLMIEADTSDIDIASDLFFSSINIWVDTGNISNLASASCEISINCGTGDIDVSDVTSENLYLYSTTGRISVNNSMIYGEVKLVADTGDISLSNTVSTGNLNATADTGGVKFEKIDASEVIIKTETGDVEGSFISEKIIFATSETGDINIPKLTSGGRCDISTETGNINITIE